MRGRISRPDWQGCGRLHGGLTPRKVAVFLAVRSEAFGPSRYFAGSQNSVAIGVPVQPVDATQALNLSAGVSNPRVLRGRSLSWRATLFRWACEYTDRSAPFGKYCLSRPLVFSLEPRCHGLCGSQK